MIQSGNLEIVVSYRVLRSWLELLQMSIQRKSASGRFAFVLLFLHTGKDGPREGSHVLMRRLKDPIRVV